jgi:hypothetical protein
MMWVKVGVSQGDIAGRTSRAVQQAIDAAARRGGGTVELGPGVYTLYDTVRVKSHVRLVGAGPDTILRKCDGVVSALVVDADYGQTKVTARDASGFRAGMGAVVRDNGSGGWTDSLASVTLVQGSVIHLGRELVADYDCDNGGQIANVFPLVAGFGIEGAVIEGLCLDGNRTANPEINGCIGAACYLYRARNCRISDCLIRDFAGDGVSFQITQGIVVERCEVRNSSARGIHPGSGSASAIVRNCRSHHNGRDGLYVCWRVQNGWFEANELHENVQSGISIGHKDTDNLFLGNRIWGNESHGVLFRDEKVSNAASRNVLRGNEIRDNVGSGIEIRGHSADLLFEGNVVRDTRVGAARTQRVGIRAGEHTQRIRALNNRIENHQDGDVQGNVVVEEERTR